MRAMRHVLPHGCLAIGLLCLGALEGRAQTSTPATLTLDEAVHLGLAHHPAIGVADANVLRARAALASARAMLLPTVSASEEAVVSTDPVFSFGAKLRQARFSSADFDVQVLNHPSAIGNFASSASAKWTAFDFGKTQSHIRSAREGEQAAQLTRDFTDQQISEAITTLFYRCLLAESQVGTARANLMRAKEIAADIRDRVESGLALESDGLRVDLATRNAEDDLATTQVNVRVARQDLFDAIGQTGTDRVPVAPLDESPTIAIPSGASLASRPDLKALDEQRASAQHILASVHASARPVLTTYAQVESNNPHITGGGGGNWTIGAKLELTVFDGGARSAKELEAAADIARLAAQRAQVELEAKSRVRALEAEFENLNRRKASAKQAIQAAEEGLKTARDRCAAGLVPISEVLTEEVELSAAEFDLVRTTYQVRITQTELEFVTGTLTVPEAGQFQ